MEYQVRKKIMNKESNVLKKTFNASKFIGR